MIRLRLVLWSISRFFITPAAVVGTRVPPAKSADFAELAPYSDQPGRRPYCD